MEALTYRKIICNAGHESRPYAEGEILPRRCPVCNQPYDRKYNHPILCYSDGSTENKSDIPSQESNDIRTEDIQVDEETVDKEQVDIRQTEVVPEDEPTGSPPLRRGRSVDLTLSQPQHIISRRRPQPLGMDEQTGQGRERIQSTGKNSVVKNTDSAIGLFNGGDMISVPEEGCVLGRESYASDILAINPQVSRKHAYIKADRVGNVFIRDEGSLNGTYVDDGNGRRKIPPHETVELKTGDTIWLGNHILVIRTIQ